MKQLGRALLIIFWVVAGIIYLPLAIANLMDSSGNQDTGLLSPVVSYVMVFLWAGSIIWYVVYYIKAKKRGEIEENGDLLGRKKNKDEEEELRNQVENYDTLKITKSARGVATLAIGFFMLITLALYYFEVVPSEVLWGVLIYIVFAYFIYKGHRWAIIATMIMWTADKAYQIGMGEVKGIGIFFWWIALMSPLYSALKVENARRKQVPTPKVGNSLTQVPIATQSNDGQAIFCHKCGTKLTEGASFCQRCGNKIL